MPNSSRPFSPSAPTAAASDCATNVSALRPSAEPSRLDDEPSRAHLPPGWKGGCAARSLLRALLLAPSLSHSPRPGAISGVLAGGVFAEGGLRHHPVEGLPLPLDAFHHRVVGEPHLPQPLEEARPLPLLDSWKRSWTVELAPSSLGSAFHWMPVRST